VCGLYVLISEFRTLQFQSGIDYPEWSGHKNIHYTYIYIGCLLGWLVALLVGWLVGYWLLAWLFGLLVAWFYGGFYIVQVVDSGCQSY